MRGSSAAKRALSAVGWYVRRTMNLPTGVDLASDLKRRVLQTSAPVVFDVGANVGQTATWIKQRFPGATVHCFEPVPATFEDLVVATRRLGGVTCHKLALGEERGSADVWAIPREVRNSLATQIFREHPAAELVKIDVSTVDAVCAAEGIEVVHVLKTDTEGFDVAVIGGARRLLGSGGVSAVVSEITFDSENMLHSSFSDVRDALAEFGMLPCGFYDTETLFRRGELGTYCNALFVRTELLERVT